MLYGTLVGDFISFAPPPGKQESADLKKFVSDRRLDEILEQRNDASRNHATFLLLPAWRSMHSPEEGKAASLETKLGLFLDVSFIGAIENVIWR